MTAIQEKIELKHIVDTIDKFHNASDFLTEIEDWIEGDIMAFKNRMRTEGNILIVTHCGGHFDKGWSLIRAFQINHNWAVSCDIQYGTEVDVINKILNLLSN